jgi:D-alanyl-D-alanine carboxypeptidase
VPLPLEEIVPFALTNLDRRLQGRAVGGVGVVVGEAAQVSSAWLPPTLAKEPLFLTYSISKTFIATLALILQEEQRLSLDDAAGGWFAELAPWPGITVRRLLSHTAGIPDYGGLEAYQDAVRRSPREPWTFEDFATHTWRRGLRAEPGTTFSYSNPGYMLVRCILERVSGQSFRALVDSRICAPLALTRSYVPDTPAAMRLLAPASSTMLSPERDRRDVRDWYHPGWVAHGVVASTPSETALFLHSLFAGRLCGASSLAELTRRTPMSAGPPRWEDPSYALGLMAALQTPVGPVFGHNGGGVGYNVSVFHAPRRVLGGATICVMSAFEEDDFLAENVVLDSMEQVAPG